MSVSVFSKASSMELEEQNQPILKSQIAPDTDSMLIKKQHGGPSLTPGTSTFFAPYFFLGTASG